MGVNKVILGNENIIDISDSSVSTSNLLQNETAYDASGTKITGQMTNNGAMSGSILTPSQSITIPSGYHNGNGSVSIDSTEAAKITAGNIKKGVTILGVTGDTCVDTSDANAVANDMFRGKTAYVNGNKISGTLMFAPAAAYTYPTTQLRVYCKPPVSLNYYLEVYSEHVFNLSEWQRWNNPYYFASWVTWKSETAGVLYRVSYYLYGCNTNSMVHTDWTSIKGSNTSPSSTASEGSFSPTGTYVDLSTYSYTWYKVRLGIIFNKNKTSWACASVNHHL